MRQHRLGPLVPVIRNALTLAGPELGLKDPEKTKQNKAGTRLTVGSQRPDSDRIRDRPSDPILNQVGTDPQIEKGRRAALSSSMAKWTVKPSDRTSSCWR